MIYANALILNDFFVCSRESFSLVDAYIATSQYEAGFEVLLNEKNSYAAALKQLIAGIGDIRLQNKNCIDFIARKILNQRNDDVHGFFAELKTIESTGYKFDVILANVLMESCIEKYNMDFYQFIQTRVVNQMTKIEIDGLNQPLLDRFVKVRLSHVAQQRYLGLPRTTRKSKH